MFCNKLMMSARGRGAVQVAAVVLTAAALAACAQAPMGTQSYSSHQAAQQRVAKRHSPLAVKEASLDQSQASGLASYYSSGSRTANGEQFNPNEFTAAHRTLPFGTKLRVTNVATGQSVTVRVNDRGPFVPGRVVDVSSSAAGALGMTGKGVAKVKLDVVQ
jgi:rare lipoprotein A